MEIQQRWQTDSPEQTEHVNGKHERLANGLGWFSIGLGLAEVAAPGKVAPAADQRYFGARIVPARTADG